MAGKTSTILIWGAGVIPLLLLFQGSAANGKLLLPKCLTAKCGIMINKKGYHMNNTTQQLTDKVRDFKADRANLLSACRLSSYDYDIDRHDENLELIATITPKLALIEIYLRNIVDFCMQEKTNDINWLENYDDDIVQNRWLDEIKARYEGQELSSDQLLSNLTLGGIIYILKKERLQTIIFDFRHIRMSDFDSASHRERLSLHRMVDVALNLLSKIRNRSFHWENLLKTRTLCNGRVGARLVTQVNGIVFGVMPDKINDFLEMLLKQVSE